MARNPEIQQSKTLDEFQQIPADEITPDTWVYMDTGKKAKVSDLIAAGSGTTLSYYQPISF